MIYIKLAGKESFDMPASWLSASFTWSIVAVVKSCNGAIED